jgi:hypothetical protein
MAKSHLKLVAPATKNRTVATPRRPKNAEVRTREYLTDAEVARLTEAAKGNRDATMILVAYRHGLRSSDWSTCNGTRSISRRRHTGRPPGQEGLAEHASYLRHELRALRRLAREQDPKSFFVFTSERGAPFTRPDLPYGRRL